IDVGYMPASFNRFDAHLDSPYGLAIASLFAAERARIAQAEGYDVFIPFGMLDIGVELARHRVDIPVIGQCESTYAFAGMMSDACAAIWYTSNVFGFGWKQVEQYRAGGIVKEFAAPEMTLAEMASQPDELKRRFVGVSKAAVGRGAELIVCAGMSM